MIDAMAATFGPASALPRCSQFLRPRARGPHPAFAPVVVHLHHPVLQMDFQPAPLPQRLIAGLGQSGSQQDLLMDRHAARFQCRHER